MSRVYVSGPISGTPGYMQKFGEAEAQLTKGGYVVINPAKVNAQLPDSLSHAEYMRISIAMLDMCDVIYLLKGWRDSRGASMEYGYALGKDMIIMEER